MTEISRRSFLIKGGAGAAALGALSVLPGLEGRADAAQGAPKGTRRAAPAVTRSASASASESLVVHIPDPRSGEIHFLIGTTEVVQTDKALVARLLREVR
jgi:hypothetical protein